MIIDIRTQLYTILSNIATTYYENAPLDATYPYLVYNLEDSQFDGANTEIFQLYINGWDKSDSSAALEGIMQSVQDAINNKVINGTKVSMHCILDSRLNIDEESDDRLKRREYRYGLRVIS
jgi:hypothetical protein